MSIVELPKFIIKIMQHKDLEKLFFKGNNFQYLDMLNVNI